METFRFNKYLIAVSVLLSSCWFCGMLYASEPEQRVNSNITNVTVFLNQAQITRSAKISLNAGVTQLVFDRISPYVNLNSLQVKTESNVSLLSVSQRNNFLKDEEKPKLIIDLEDSLQVIKQQLETVRIKKEALYLEKEVLLSNKQIGGVNSGVKIEDLEDALALFRKRSIEIGEELLKHTNNEIRLKLIQQKLQAQWDSYNNGRSNIVEVVVTLKTLSAVNNTRIELTYLTGNAAWKPFYDIRVKDTKSALQLVSKAYITQATGEDWNNVILKLSTNNPNEGSTKPELNTLYLRTQSPIVYQKREIMALPQRKASEVETLAGVDSRASEAPMLFYSQGNAIELQSEANIEFNVTSAYSIPTDNNPHQVDLTVNNIHAVYAYGAVPKLDKDAFVTAKVSGNDLVNQISGDANVYFDGTYTGKTYINGTSSDSLLLSLGRDKRIQIQRTLLKDFSSKSFSGGTRKELSTWEVSIRNTRKEPIVIVVEDQIPLSTEKEIEVKLLSNGGAAYEETTGKLTWVLFLEGEKSQSVKFSFEVKYPKEKLINPY
jgi:uncharacterized protein (TIGR02231 family)